MAATAASLGLPYLAPEDPNRADCVEALRATGADLFLLAGYGKILRSALIALPRRTCINLHGGKVPAYRGSSPLNWSLINGEPSFR